MRESLLPVAYVFVAVVPGNQRSEAFNLPAAVFRLPLAEEARLSVGGPCQPELLFGSGEVRSRNHLDAQLVEDGGVAPAVVVNPAFIPVRSPEANGNICHPAEGTVCVDHRVRAMSGGDGGESFEGHAEFPFPLSERLNTAPCSSAPWLPVPGPARRPRG